MELGWRPGVGQAAYTSSWQVGVSVPAACASGIRRPDRNGQPVRTQFTPSPALDPHEVHREHDLRVSVGSSAARRLGPHPSRTPRPCEAIRLARRGTVDRADDHAVSGDLGDPIDEVELGLDRVDLIWTLDVVIGVGRGAGEDDRSVPPLTGTPPIRTRTPPARLSLLFTRATIT